MIDIDPSITAKVPQTRLAAVTARIEVGPSPPALRQRLDQAIAAIDSLAAIQAKPAIAATRAAYKHFGKDPSRYRPAAEALARRVAQKKGLGSINRIVDINNTVSLETGLSIGAYDLERIEPPFVLRLATADESYHGIGRGPLNLEGLPVICDGMGPFGSPTSDSERSMVTESCTTLMMVLFDFGAGTLDQAIIDDTAELLRQRASAREITWSWSSP